MSHSTKVEGVFELTVVGDEVYRPVYINYFCSHPRRQQLYNEVVNLNEDLKDIRTYENTYRQNCIVAIEDTVYEIDRVIPCILTLDLHGFRNQSAKRAANRFIKLTLRYSIPRMRIIFGRGDTLSHSIPRLLELRDLEFSLEGESRHDLGYGDTKYGYADISLPDPCIELWPHPEFFIMPTGRWSRRCVVHGCGGWIEFDPDISVYQEVDGWYRLDPRRTLCRVCGTGNDPLVHSSLIVDGECPNCKESFLYIDQYDWGRGELSVRDPSKYEPDNETRQQCPSCNQVWQIKDGNLVAIDTLDGYRKVVERKKLREEKERRERQERDAEIWELHKAILTGNYQNNRNRSKRRVRQQNNSYTLFGIFVGGLVALVVVYGLTGIRSVEWFLLSWVIFSAILKVGLHTVGEVKREND